MDTHENAAAANARAAAESAKHAATAAGLAEIDAKKAAACDLVAKIHEGEAIVPAAFNPWPEALAMGREIVRLNTQMARLLERWDSEGLPYRRGEV